MVASALASGYFPNLIKIHHHHVDQLNGGVLTQRRHVQLGLLRMARIAPVIFGCIVFTAIISISRKTGDFGNVAHGNAESAQQFRGAAG